MSYSENEIACYFLYNYYFINVPVLKSDSVLKGHKDYYKKLIISPR